MCTLRNLLLKMLDHFVLREIAYLFEIVHTLSELCDLIESDPRKGAQGPNLPTSLDHKTQI
jgi:hypothetical protein